jgi:hypothetical protein
VSDAHATLIPRRLLRTAALVLSLLAGLTVAAVPVQASQPSNVRVELYRQGDFVSQTNSVQCVGASMQMMLNMIRSQNDRSPRTQLALQQLARKASPKRIGPGGIEFTRPRRGASSFGWAAGLSRLDGGPYRVASTQTLGGALKIAANAMRETKRPAGLLVWHGAHAWVMSGFTATRTSDGRIGRVTSITVLDPWYPRSSPTHGPSPRPGTRLTPRQLSSDYLRWRRHHASPFDGQYVLVVPYRELTLAPVATFSSVAYNRAPFISRLWAVAV